MRIDFNQNASDHAKVNVLVCPVGEISAKLLTWFEQTVVFLTKTHFSPASFGSVAFRVLRSPPKQLDELWGDFIFHRRLLGVIGVSDCRNEEQLKRVASVFGALATSYPRALRSTCVICSTGAKNLVSQNPVTVAENVSIEALECPDVDCGDPEELKTILERFADIIQQRLIVACEERDCRAEGILPRAPPELQNAALEEGRNRRKRCMGRLMKQQGDLMLLAGEAVSATAWYGEAFDILRTINDYLWMAGTLLGYCCALWRLEAQMAAAKERGETLPIMKDAVPLPASVLVPSPDPSIPQRLSPVPGNQMSQNGDGQSNDSNGLSVKPAARSPQASPEVRRRITDVSSPGKQGAPQHSLRATVGGQTVSIRPIFSTSDSWPRKKQAVTVDSGLRDAIQYLSKLEGAELLEVESCFLLARVLVEQKKYSEAAALLSETISLDFGLEFSEKLVLLITAGKLFRQMGYMRKGAFAFRLAAMQRVHSAKPSPVAWKEAYMLLSQSLEGYGMPEGWPHRVHRYAFGWPRLQACILHELAFLASRCENVVPAVSHSLVLLHSHHTLLELSDLEQVLSQLEEMSQRSKQSHQVLRLDRLPNWLLSTIPSVHSFVPMRLPRYLQPVSTSQASGSKGPFIYTPMQQRGKSTEQVTWVKDTSAEVAIELENPLPVEIRVEKMALCTSGAAFDAFPTSVSLPPHSTHSCMLVGLPKEAGEVKVVGYTASLFGVERESQVRVPQDISSVVEVTPPLPVLSIRGVGMDSPVDMSSGRVSNVSSQTTNFVAGSSVFQMHEQVCVTSGGSPCPHRAGTVVRRDRQRQEKVSIFTCNVALYPGQQMTVPLTAVNKSAFFIESMELEVEETPAPEEGGQFAVIWPEASVSSCLPLQPGQQMILPLHIQLMPWHQMLSSCLAEDCDTSGGMLRSRCKLLYSGGPGLQAGLRRCSLLEIHTRVLPLVEFTCLDILPVHGQPHLCQVCFDAHNQTTESLRLDFSWKASTADAGEAAAEQCTITTTIEPRHHDRVSLVIHRFDPSQMPHGTLSAVCQAVLDIFTKSIQVHWQLSEISASGQMLFTGSIQVLRDMLYNLQPEPLHVDIMLNGHSMDELQSDHIECVTAMPVKVAVRNVTDVALSALQLQVHLFEDLRNGYMDTELLGKCMWIGTTSVRILRLLPGEEFVLTTHLSVLAYGMYQLHASVVSTDSSASDDKWPTVFSRYSSRPHCFTPPTSFRT